MTKHFRGVTVEEVDEHFDDMAKRCREGAAIVRAANPAAADALEQEASKFLRWRRAWDVATEGKAMTVPD